MLNISTDPKHRNSLEEYFALERESDAKYEYCNSFREYLLIAQHRPHITHYVKSDTGKWDYEETNDLGSSIYLPTIDCTLALSNVYREVEFRQNPA